MYCNDVYGVLSCCGLPISSGGQKTLVKQFSTTAVKTHLEIGNRTQKQNISNVLMKWCCFVCEAAECILRRGWNAQDSVAGQQLRG